MDKLMKGSEQKIPKDVDKERLSRILQMQYPGFKAENLLKNARVVYSRKTKRISYIYQHGEHLFSLRTSDGRYLPTFAGALRLRELGMNKQSITIHPDAVPFVSDGKSLYNKHVLEVDSSILPGSEVLLLSQSKELIAVGSSIHPGYAMLELDSGVAVKVKHGRDKYLKKQEKSSEM